MNAQSPEFSRNLGFLNIEEQERINNSTVAVAGAGGDGGMLAIQLARLGVGEIRLADPDTFETENLNRQAACTTHTVGMNKAEAVAAYIRDINPNVRTPLFTNGVTRSNVKEFVAGADLLIDETEFTLHAIGVMLAREARLKKIPNLMAMNIGFGATVTAFDPEGMTFESFLGLDEDADLETIEATEVSLSRWLAYIPPYADLDVFKKVASGETTAPSIGPGVAIAAGMAASQAVLHLVGTDNNREKPVFAPRVMIIDGLTGQGKTIDHPRLSHYTHLAKMVTRNMLKRNPKASYYAEHTKKEEFDGDPKHLALFNDAIKAPSAHNAQPWKIRYTGDSNEYELHYIQNSDLPKDPDDKDAYMTMGAFVETMALQAPNRGLTVEVNPDLTRDGADMFIARIAINEALGDEALDPLSTIIGQRFTNRNNYSGEPLTPYLKSELEALGNTLVPTRSLKDIVKDASIAAWTDPEYIKDLKAWFHENDNAEAGITPAAFNLTKSDVVALKFAFWRGGFKSKALGYAYSSRDVDVFTSGPTAAIVSVSEKTPTHLFQAGRNLLRSWVTIIGEGYSYQPFSVAVDDADAARRVAKVAKVENPVALYRVGRASEPPRGYSNRRPVSTVLQKQ